VLYTILKLIQNPCFSKEFNQISKTDRADSRIQLKAMHPSIVDKELIRLSDGLKNSSLTYAEKHSIILSAKNHVMHLIIRDMHIEKLHSGTQATLYAVRAMFRPIHGKIVTKKIVK
jgi:hypothetical protein